MGSIGEINLLLGLGISAKTRAIVGRARRCRGLEIAKRRSDSLGRRGSGSHVAWKGRSTILLRMMEIGEIDILKKGRHAVTIGVSGVPLLMEHHIRRPQLGGCDARVHRVRPVHRIGGRVVITSWNGVDAVDDAVDESLIIRRGRCVGALPLC